MTEKRCDFIIIGTMKGGTSSLAEILNQHPGVCISNPKEPHFFSSPGKYPEQLADYHAMFQGDSDQLWGEGTTSYTKMPNFKPEVYDDLLAYNAGLKFFYALRHPVTRAVSHYMHMYQRRIFDYSFEEALWQSNILHTGRYYTQLRPFAERFGKESIHLYRFEDFVADQERVVREVLSFLGLSWPPAGFSPAHANSAVGANKVGAGLERFKTPAVRKFWDDQMPEGLKKIVYGASAKLTARTFKEKINVSPAVERQILELHRLDILAMEDWTGMDLTDYLTSRDGKYCVR